MLIYGLGILIGMERHFVWFYYIWLVNLFIFLTLCLKLLHVCTKLWPVVNIIWTIMIGHHRITPLVFDLLILTKKVLNCRTLILYDLLLLRTLRLIKFIRFNYWVLPNFLMILWSYTAIFKYFLHLKTLNLLIWV